MHFFLAFIQASVMCLLKYFRVFLQPSGVIPASPCLWGSSSWTCVARNGLTSQLVQISWQSSHSLPSRVFVHIKELQVPAGEVPGSEAGSGLTYSQIGKSGWFSFANWIRSLVGHGSRAATALRLAHLDPAALGSCCCLEGLEQELPVQLPEDGELTEWIPGSWH